MHAMGGIFKPHFHGIIRKANMKPFFRFFFIVALLAVSAAP
jgi:hypothetical protein